MSQPKVLIATLTWNQKQDTLECLASLQKVRYDNLEVMVVDNGSRDGTCEAIREGYPHVPIVRNEKNLGCAEGMNCNIRYMLGTDADFLFLLGNDTIVDPDVVSELVRVAVSDPRIGIVVPKIYYYDRPDVLWFARGCTMDWEKGIFTGLVQNIKDDGSQDADRDFDFSPGGFTFVRRSILEKGILLDPDYFIYFDDSDWYWRIKKDGWRFAYAPKAKVWHKPSSSVGMESPHFYYYRVRNRLLFMKKYVSSSAFRRFLLFFAWDYSWNTVYRLAREGKWACVSASMAGVRDFCLGRFGER